MDRKDREHDTKRAPADAHDKAAGALRKPAVAKPDTPAARERARRSEEDEGPLDSLGRAVSDTVTGSLPEEVPGSTSPDPDDPARP